MIFPETSFALSRVGLSKLAVFAQNDYFVQICTKVMHNAEKQMKTRPDRISRWLLDRLENGFCRVL